MPYLKSSHVTGLSPKRVDVTGFTQSAAEHLEGTYSRHEVLLADAFTITDNVTISDNLILAKLSDDGNAITVTGNATTTRTIAGSGSLEGSTFAQTPNASLTGMTGVVGSAVTGGSGLTAIGTVTTGTLGSEVAFPAGHVLQVKHAYEASSPTTVSATGSFAAVGNSYFTFPWGTEITTTVANSLIFLVAQLGNSYSTAGNPQMNTSIARYKGGTEEALCGGVATDGTAGGAIGYTTGGPPYGICRSSSPDQQKALHMSIMDKPLDAAGTVLKYYILATCVGTSAAFGYQTHNTLTVMEIMP